MPERFEVESVPASEIREGDRVLISDRVLTCTKTATFAPDVQLVEMAGAQFRRSPRAWMFRVVPVSEKRVGPTIAEVKRLLGGY